MRDATLVDRIRAKGKTVTLIGGKVHIDPPFTSDSALQFVSDNSANIIVELEAENHIREVTKKVGYHHIGDAADMVVSAEDGHLTIETEEDIRRNKAIDTLATYAEIFELAKSQVIIYEGRDMRGQILMWQGTLEALAQRGSGGVFNIAEKLALIKNSFEVQPIAPVATRRKIERSVQDYGGETSLASNPKYAPAKPVSVAPVTEQGVPIVDMAVGTGSEHLDDFFHGLTPQEDN